jgi:hypothetical protein
MRTLTLLVLLTACAIWSPAAAQEADQADGARIESAEVSGFALDELSPGLQRDIDALAGERYERERISRLVQRIEEEHPEVVAAVRTVPRPDGQVRVIFLVARISDDGDLVSNINARYTVESVEIRGVPETDIGQALRDRLQALVGHRLENDVADDLIAQLKKEKPAYDVTRRIERGTRRGQIHVIFDFSELEQLRWIPFARSRSKVVYHSDHAWAGLFDIPMGKRDHRFTAGFAVADDDTLIEEYSGVRMRFESRHIGSERVGANLEVSWFNDTWEGATLSALAANPAIPEAYRSRVTVEPHVIIALTRQVRVTGGFSISDLVSLSRSPASYTAGAFVAGIDYRDRWDRESRSRQGVEAGYELRSSTTAFESDVAYKRHFGYARYQYDHYNNTVIAGVFLGRITGNAPLFERFTLGDTSTLRGWSKYDIAPAGGDRVFHQTLEYRYHSVGAFLDTGSVWNGGTGNRVRTSTGFGVLDDHFFLTVAFPLNGADSGPTFMTGVRF